ncbi:hypothetical protein XM52_04650 [Roseovarius indicus]|uniref:Uncharacterized protein n=1 Tax=Roseovarius indicus TaxID=540747 RepID=A0A0T5PD70_9RHOB|nr:hypothetical protein [Roseovarius indicus]KRS18968.1 hypothetical protein XM52_04650 [Roseovarius indicus]
MWGVYLGRAANPDLPTVLLSAQSHYAPSDRFAFVEVFGLGEDRTRRQKIRAEADDLLRCLGYTVELKPGRDVYDETPRRPTSAHDELRMLRCLRAACGMTGEGR